MGFPQISLELIATLERFNAAFHAARMLALGPELAEVKSFGGITAVKVRHPLMRGKNRAFGLTRNNAESLDELVAWYSADKLPLTISVAYGEMDRKLFARLATAGFWSRGINDTPGMVPDDDWPQPDAISIRESSVEEREAYLDLFQKSFHDRVEGKEPGYRAIHWAEDSLPGGKRFIASVDGVPAGMAAMPVVEGVAYMSTSGVLPAFRRRGIHSALIRHRLNEARRLGCKLAIGGAPIGHPARRNFERAGMRIIPVGMSWQRDFK